MAAIGVFVPRVPGRVANAIETMKSRCRAGGGKGNDPGRPLVVSGCDRDN